MKIVVAHPRENLPEDVYGSWSPAPAPDGRTVAFVSDRGGTPQIWLRILAAEGWTRLETDLERVSTVSWSPDGKWLLCSVAAHGSSRSEAYVVPAAGGRPRLLAGGEHVTVVLGAGPHRGWYQDGRVLLTEVGSAAESTAYLVDPLDPTRREVVAEGELLIALELSEDTKTVLVRSGPRGRRSLHLLDRVSGTLSDLELGDGPGSSDLGFLAADGSGVFALTSVGRELSGLVRVGPDGVARTFAERPDAELELAVPSADGSSVALVWNLIGGRSAVTVLDPTAGVQRVLELPRDVVGDARFLPDGTTVAITGESWSDPKGVWLLHPEDGPTPVSSDGGHVLVASPAASSDAVDTAALEAPELHSFASADGTVVSGWLYRPAGATPGAAVIWLHGGPESQERPVYNSLFQSLRAAGCAVFALNVRGSSGFGRTFVHADDLELRYGAIDDVAGAAGYLVDAGIGAAGRIGVMGRSYGGYLTLAALVWHPELFAAGVDICGMSDFSTFYEHTEPYIAATAVSKYGDPVRDRELLHDLSPMTRIDKLRAPLLVVHGAEDTNVPLVEAQQVVTALAERGVTHRFLLFEGEGHELLATPNRVRFVQETVDWVRRHLG